MTPEPRNEAAAFFKNTTRTEPTTAAGRELVEEEPRLIHGDHSMLRRVLAIEDEAAERAAPKVDVERLAEAMMQHHADIGFHHSTGSCGTECARAVLARLAGEGER